MKVVLFIILALIPFNAFADRFETALERCAPYRLEIEEILQEEGVSKDFYYLALAESTCDFKNVSKAGAVGLWQLMPSTARRYGLRVDPELDERFDWRLSTRAAAQYLNSLYSRFRDFEWTVAAYNAGGSNLIKKTGFKRGSGLRVGVLRTLAPASFALVQTVKHWRKKDALQVDCVL